MMRLAVHHTTTYTYSEPARRVIQQASLMLA